MTHSRGRARLDDTTIVRIVWIPAIGYAAIGLFASMFGSCIGTFLGVAVMDPIQLARPFSDLYWYAEIVSFCAIVGAFSGILASAFRIKPLICCNWIPFSAAAIASLLFTAFFLHLISLE